MISNNEISDNPDIIYTLVNPPRKCIKRLLNVCDSLLSLFVITPLVVSHWNGTWALMDDYVEQFPAILCYLFGCVLHTCFVIIKEFLHVEYTSMNLNNKNEKTIKRTTSKILGMRIYTYFFSLGCNMQWRGCWAILESYFGAEFWTAFIPVTISVIVLISLKSLRNLLAPPTFVIIDSKEFVFTFPTRFKYNGTREPGLYVLDCTFSVLVIGTLVVIAWRSVWVILDLTLYPDNPTFSAWGSLAIGYGVVAVTFTLQPIVKWACDHLNGLWRLTVADIFLFISFIGTVNAWRGIWHLLDIYFLPGNRLLSDWITHAFSFILLTLLNCSNSVLVRGVYIDAEEPAGQCVVFPIHYIRLFFQKERNKKQKRLLDTLEKQDQNNAMFLLDKVTISHNNIKIIKTNNNSSNKSNQVQSQNPSEIKPMLQHQHHNQFHNEKTKNGGDHTIIKE